MLLCSKPFSRIYRNNWMHFSCVKLIFIAAWRPYGAAERKCPLQILGEGIDEIERNLNRVVLATCRRLKVSLLNLFIYCSVFESKQKYPAESWYIYFMWSWTTLCLVLFYVSKEYFILKSYKSGVQFRELQLKYI